MAAADHRPDAIFLLGATATGKTALAIELAARFPLALISVDSAQVYRGMDIGSAKPDAATLARIPHALIDIREPAQGYSAAEFRVDALDAMQRAHACGRVPLLVGGTLLYFRALEWGLSALPRADPEVRARIEADARVHGWPALHARLAARDPLAAARIHRNDPQRIERALEVIELTGATLSGQQHGRGQRLPWRLLKLAAHAPDRANLHARIATRVQQMVVAGLLAEVERLRGMPGLRVDSPAMRAVGYRQAWEHLDGEVGREEFIARTIHATRQLAKRQLTWLRSERDALELAPSGTDAAQRVAGFLRPITFP
jgi:tRNA dimethylallyltransferase